MPEHTWKSDGIFLTIYRPDKSVDSVWVLYEKRMLAINPYGTAIIKL